MRVFQDITTQMANTTQRILGVTDNAGNVVACTDPARIGDKSALVGFTVEPMRISDYNVFVEGNDELAVAICAMANIALSEAKIYYDECYDKATFIKHILLDNILTGDVYARARELNIDCDKPRVVLLIKQQGKVDVAAVDVLQGLFPEDSGDYIIGLNDDEIVLVKQVREDVDVINMGKLAAAIEETLGAELYIKTAIGIGTPVTNLKNLAMSYKEAQTAIEVGMVFDADHNIIQYENLGIARLIYQLPTPLCEMFLKEVFKLDTIDKLDYETLHTIQKFFENNLNVSETARKLFVHRNTLVYRLEKMKRTTGLDLREFEHAVIFKVAHMVSKYLKSQGRNL